VPKRERRKKRKLNTGGASREEDTDGEGEITTVPHTPRWSYGYDVPGRRSD